MNNFINEDIMYFHILLLSLCLNFIFILKWTNKSRYLKNKKALIESKDKYKSLVESLLEGIGIVDENENFTFANKAGNEIFGCGKEKLVGKNLKEFTSEENYNFILEKTQHRKQGKTEVYELEITGLDKVERTLLVKSSPVIDDKGNYKGGFGLYSDISDQKKHELKRDKIIDELESKIIKGKRIKNGFLPICASCHKIRDENKIWHPIADYLTENTDIKFSHSV
ncbi:MAG: PAS domain S-box protein, partial [Candidatus Delongbacteria bacterium]|nr:PAS domain S-box protein [Candidatus Delongbacteria bacterium]